MGDGILIADLSLLLNTIQKDGVQLYKSLSFDFCHHVVRRAVLHPTFIYLSYRSHPKDSNEAAVLVPQLKLMAKRYGPSSVGPQPYSPLVLPFGYWFSTLACSLQWMLIKLGFVGYWWFITSSPTQMYLALQNDNVRYSSNFMRVVE
ncbi:MAG: hypothetical protein CM15mP83_7220 [Flavobacteriaceae bacterium]|nr:MAG: hypothetical protein CM15mP83_7220 [Flavobacteriaceae bacterium]